MGCTAVRPQMDKRVTSVTSQRIRRATAAALMVRVDGGIYV